MDNLKSKLLPCPRYLERGQRLVTPKNPISPVSRLEDILNPGQQQKYKDILSNPGFKQQGYIFSICKNGARVYSETPQGRFYGQNTAQKIIDLTEKKPLTEVLVVDWPESDYRGPHEGFYGLPWTWNQRREVIKKSSEYGANLFVFSPPDFYLRAKWRDPLDPGFSQELEKLINFAHSQNTKFVYEILPLQMDLSSEQEYRTLLDRCLEVVELGADSIMIALDDSDDYQKKGIKNKKAAKNLANVANMLFTKLSTKGVTLCVVPVEYYGTNPTQYLQILGRELDKEIFVGWSGPKIRSSNITSEDIDRFSEIIKRKPFLGHNFPVVDEVNKKRRVTLSPLVGLGPNLLSRVSGIAFNCMPLPYTSLFPLLTALDYSWNSLEYDPKQSITNSASIFGKSLLSLYELNPESYANPNAAHPFERNLKRLRDMGSSDREKLETIFSKMVLLEEQIQRDADPRIYEELKPWIYQARMVGTLGQIVLSNERKFNWKVLGWGSLKVNAGHRLSRRTFEDWIFREMGFPMSLLQYAPFRLFFDFLDSTNRKRHSK